MPKSWLRRLFAVPSPVELGRSSYNALPCRSLGAAPDAYTWEDWREETKAAYPVRYFLSQTLVSWFRRGGGRLARHWYWLKCQVLPEYRGYSRIDIRKPGPGIDYSHGWVDRSEAFLYAAFVCLREFVEKEDHDPFKGFSPEEIAADPQLALQKATRDEMLVIYDWWMKGRVEEENEEHRLFDVYDGFRYVTDQDRAQYEEAREAWLAYTAWRVDREDEMLIRLCRIRRSLWT